MPDKAIKYYLEARSDLERKNFKDDTQTVSRIALGLAEAYFQKNEYNLAIEEAKNCEHEKSKGWGFYWRSRACIEQKKNDQAKVFAKKSYELLGNSTKSIKKLIKDLKLENIIKESVVMNSQNNLANSNSNISKSTDSFPRQNSNNFPNLYKENETTIRPDSETDIFEEKKPTNSNASMSNFDQQPDLSNIDPGKLDYMSSMMKTSQGRDMMKNVYKTQMGMDISDEQQNMMAGFMTPETMKMGMNMQKQMQQQGVDTSNLSEVQKASQNMKMPSMPGMSNQMGQNPNQETVQGGTDNQGQPQMPDMGNMEGMLNNPEMINNIFDMAKSNPGMLRSMVQMAPNAPGAGWLATATDDQLLRMITWIHRLYKVGRPCWPVVKFIICYWKYLVGLFAAYLVKRWFL